MNLGTPCVHTHGRIRASSVHARQSLAVGTLVPKETYTLMQLNFALR